MNVRPLHDVLIVELEPVRETTSGGLIVPATVSPSIRTGRVLRAGPGRAWKPLEGGKKVFWPMDVRVGERVAFFTANLEHKQGRQICYVLGDNEALLRETDVLFVVDDGVEVS